MPGPKSACQQGIVVSFYGLAPQLSFLVVNVCRPTFPGAARGNEDPLAREGGDWKPVFKLIPNVLSRRMGAMHTLCCIQGKGKVSAIPSQTTAKWYSASVGSLVIK